MKRGRPFALGELDAVVKSYIRALREAGTPINAPIVIAAVNGIVSSKDCSLLSVNGDLIELDPGWAKSLLTRMGFEIHHKLCGEEVDSRRI